MAKSPPILRLRFRTGKGGRIRWFVTRKYSKRIAYSSFPNSFSTKQEAWEHAEWAVGASVTLEYEHPTQGFQRCTREREWR